MLGYLSQEKIIVSALSDYVAQWTGTLTGHQEPRALVPVLPLFFSTPLFTISSFVLLQPLPPWSFDLGWGLYYYANNSNGKLLAKPLWP